MNEATAPLPPGSRLAHYEVRGVLGTGGMGTVYLARDVALDRPVALKVFHPETGADPHLKDGFLREARAAAKVSHPNVAHVYFAEETGGQRYFAMEFCPGRTLEAAVREEGPFSLTRGLEVLSQAARGLAAAHRMGVVHRDVKPGNLMLLPDGTVKVADFGLAKSLGVDSLATAGRILGTPHFMSPEQVRGKPVDARTDIYLLGLTAWFLFAGRPPYGSAVVGELIHDQLVTPLPALSAARPELPAPLDAALARMCAKDPADRPASMEEVLRVLDALRPLPLIPAPLMARGAALAVDLGLLAVLGLAIAGFDKALTGDAFPDALYGPFVLTFSVLLFVAAEIRWGASGGKMFFNLAVVRGDGVRAPARAAVLRYLLRLPLALDVLVGEERGAGPVAYTFFALQALAVLAGVVSFLVTRGRTLSDVLTDTRVVYRLPGSASRYS